MSYVVNSYLNTVWGGSVGEFANVGYYADSPWESFAWGISTAYPYNNCVGNVYSGSMGFPLLFSALSGALTKQMEVGMLFRHINLPSDAVITNATLTIVPSEWFLSTRTGTSYGYPTYTNYVTNGVNTRIYLQNSITPSTFFEESVVAYFARSRTAAIDWDNIQQSAWTMNRPHTSPDIKTLVQALVDTYGALDDSTICLFWGDKDGRTTVNSGDPNPIYHNFLGCRFHSTPGYPTASKAKLRIEFTSGEEIPDGRTSFFKIGDDEIQDATYRVEGTNILNDVRALIPNYTTQLDTTQSPPVIVPVDYSMIKRDDNSIQKYGRRSWIDKNPNGRWDYTGEELCDYKLRKYKEPAPQLALKVMGASDATIVKLLSASISDKMLVSIDDMELNMRYWIDKVSLEMRPNYMKAGYELVEIGAPLNISGIFELDVDNLNDPEELLA